MKVSSQTCRLFDSGLILLIGFSSCFKIFQTYEHFLNELKETIITSPPYTNDWSGLDGAWYGRYIYHVNKVRKGFVLHAKFAKLPKSFISIKGGFWVVVILFDIMRSRGFAVVFGTQVTSMERFWAVVIFMI